MSAPDTILEQQKRNHRSALIGMGIVVAIALALFLGLSFWLADRGQTSGETVIETPLQMGPVNG